MLAESGPLGAVQNAEERAEVVTRELRSSQEMLLDKRRALEYRAQVLAQVKASIVAMYQVSGTPSNHLVSSSCARL